MYHFIINPISRTGHAQEVWRQVEEELKSQDREYLAHMTMYGGHARKLAEELTSAGSSCTLVVIGGDGTINEVIDGIRDYENTVLGYIPTGSGNDFAKGMGIPQEPLEALKCILDQPHCRAMDVGVIETLDGCHHFGVSAGLGFDAAICHEALCSPIKKVLNKLRLGKLTYMLIAVKQLLMWKPGPLILTLDGCRRFTYEKAFFAAVMNQSCEGGGLKLCPKAAPDDGYLDVFVAAGISKLKILFMLPTAFWGKHTKLKGVHILRCRSIKLHSEEQLPVHRDGESNGFYQDLSISLEYSTLNVITPVL